MGSLQLRTILRNVNTEFSALLRDPAATDRIERLASLGRERERLMRLLSQSAPSLRLVTGGAQARANSIANGFSVSPDLPIPMAASGMASSPFVTTGGS